MTDRAISPLRRRMIEETTIRKLGAKTQHDYVQRVKDFATFLGRSPDTASKEDVRRYASGVERCRHAEDQRHRLTAAALHKHENKRFVFVGKVAIPDQFPWKIFGSAR